jgi:hypothetical protein
MPATANFNAAGSTRDAWSDHGDRPFQWALGVAIESLAPAVQEHILQEPGTVVVYRGRMQVSRDGGVAGAIAGVLLHLGRLCRFMFPETGEDVDFEIRHEVARHADGGLSMSWIRTYRFPRATRRFDAMMHFHPDNGPIVRWTGCRGLVEVELCPRVEGDAIVVESRREWLTLGPLRVPIPTFLKGRPLVREWQEADGSLYIRVEIFNSLLGRFFGYEGRYCRVQEGR